MARQPRLGVHDSSVPILWQGSRRHTPQWLPQNLGPDFAAVKVTASVECLPQSLGVTRPNRVIVVEFGPLTADQKAFVDLHPLRAVGTEPPAPQDDNGLVIQFWVRDCETAEELYDDIRGWAIGNRLPVRGLVEV